MCELGWLDLKIVTLKVKYDSARVIVHFQCCIIVMNPFSLWMGFWNALCFTPNIICKISFSEKWQNTSHRKAISGTLKILWIVFDHKQSECWVLGWVQWASKHIWTTDTLYLYVFLWLVFVVITRLIVVCLALSWGNFFLRPDRQQW